MAAAFWSLSKFICRLSAINRFSFNSIFWIKLVEAFSQLIIDKDIEAVWRMNEHNSAFTCV